MPVIPIRRLEAGIHKAKIEGFEYRSSTSNQNPMVVMEVSLESGELVNVYLMVTVDARDLVNLLVTCGERQVARELAHKKNPSFELDDLIGRDIQVVVYADQSIKLYGHPFIV